MAEVAVSFLLEQLETFLVEEANLLGGLRDEVEHIREELQSMRAFLKAADATEETDPQLQEWVRQVREAAYDTEGALDEFILRLSRHHGTGFYGFLRKMSWSVKNLKARHRIASEIRRLRSKVAQIAERRHRYGHSVTEQGSTSRSEIVNNRRNDALLLEEAELVGIEEPKKQLIEMLLTEDDDPRLKVVPVVGMGGLGKTALVKKVYDDVQVKRQFQSHAWITVSQSPETRKLLKDLTEQLFKEFKQPVPENTEDMDAVKLKTIIKGFLQDKRYVVVLDDVWSTDAWDAFKHALPSSSCGGSRVMLTTRILDVASTSTKEFRGNSYPMDALSGKESWTLFCRKAFQGNQCPPHLEEIALGILQKCKGLPLAIVTIGGLLATKDQSGIHEWEMVHRSLTHGGTEGNDKLEIMKKILSLSYNDLPYYLKICFLYLSIFPDDYLLERMRLIRLWSAEGFVKEKEGKTVEEVAEGCLIDLVNRGLVHVAKTNSDGSVRVCRVHDLLHEIVVSKSKEYNTVTIASEGSRSSWPENVRRLSIHYSTGDIPNKHFSRLRSLLTFEVAHPLMCGLLTGGGSARLLKVLDLRGASLERIPNEVLKLYHLKYLSLRETKVKTIPDSIGNLENLETLDLKQTYVTELPVQILKLQRLRHLLVYRYEKEPYLNFHATECFKAPKGIGNLVNLQKLCFVDVKHGDGSAVMGELGKMTQLRRLGVVKLRKEDGKALCSSIEKMSNLRSLSIYSLAEEDVLDIQNMATPRLLQRLSLKGRLEKLPNWIHDLHNLVKLELKWNRLGEDPLQSLQHLPNLADLELREAYDGEGLRFRAGGFQKLKILTLSRLGVRWVRVEEGAVPRLEEFRIQICNLMEEVPSGIQHITSLKTFLLRDMSDKLIEALDPEKGDDYWKIAHIPLVQIASYGDGTGKKHVLGGDKTTVVSQG